MSLQKDWFKKIITKNQKSEPDFRVETHPFPPTFPITKSGDDNANLTKCMCELDCPNLLLLMRFIFMVSLPNLKIVAITTPII
jgi:hypothetical protein